MADKQTSKALYDEPPLLVFPSLAKRIGLNEAIVVQQLHYWLQNAKSGKVVDGTRWIYNSVEEWREQFPFWSRNTIRRILEKLEQLEIVIVGNFNDLSLDHTKWYRLDYEKLDEYHREKKKGKAVNFGKSSTLANRSSKVGQKDLPNFGNAIPETSSETSKQKETKTLAPASPAPAPSLPSGHDDNGPNPVENAQTDGKPPTLKESSEPQKKSSGKRKVSDVPPAGDPALDAITILCYGTKDAYFPNSKRIRNCYRDVAKVDGPPTIEELRGFYLWWKREDWRGQKGQAPKPNQVSELWATFKSALKGVNPDVQFLEKTGTDGAKSKVWGWSGK